VSEAVEAKVLGLDELARGTKDLAGRIDRSAGPAMERGAQLAATIARATVPVLTGTLRGSIATASNEGKAQLGMGEGLPYAGWIEYGGTRGRPYVDRGRNLYPAAVKATPVALASASSQAEKEIAKYPWKRPPT
jgi:phage gpG-like protein